MDSASSGWQRAKRYARPSATAAAWLALALAGAAGCGGGGYAGASGTGGAGGNGAGGGMAGSSGKGGGSGGGGSGGDAGMSEAGGSGGNMAAAACGFTACGGEVDGEWKAREACLVELEPNPEPGCESAFAHSAELEGTYTFFAETGRLLTDVTLTPIVTLDVDDTCATAIADGAASAAQACPLLQARYEESDSFDSVACEMQAGTCHCVLRQASLVQNVLNMYTTSGTRILDMQGDPVDYCVDGDELGIQYETGGFVVTLLFDRQ